MSKQKARPPRTVAEPVRASLPPESKPALPFHIPPILFEGDETEAPPAARPEGNAARQTPGASSPAQIEESKTGEPADARSSVQLLLLARDSHILYAHWNLTQTQQARYNALSADGHLVIQVSGQSARTDAEGASAAPEVFDIHVLPDSTHWFIHVDRADSRYVAELGLYSKEGRWTSIATSAAIHTPPEHVSEDRTVRMGVIGTDGVKAYSDEASAGQEAVPPDLQSEPTIKSPVVLSPEAIGAIVPPRVSWIPALGIDPSEPRAETAFTAPPGSQGHQAGGADEDIAIENSQVAEPHNGIPTEAIADWLHQEAEGEGIENLSSLSGQKAFWFKVGAELVVYGATEPSATVALQGNPIRLSSAGTFSCRLAFPEGEQEFELVATSTDGRTRRVLIKVFRATEPDQK